MRYSRFFIKTAKDVKQLDSINATLLQKAGFIDQTMAGVYTFLPLGLKVLMKIEAIIREEMDTLGAEMLMPALVPKALWQQSGRLETVDVLFEAQGANELSRQKNDASYVLSPTHEDVITPLAQKIKLSYKDLPFAVYQIQTKFRNEPRPKSGLLRGREFRMKDLYSFHASEDDLKEFYENVKKVYTTIFKRLGIGEDTLIVRASGGDFTRDFSHEFQTKCETGEDTIYLHKATGIAYNKEIVPDEVARDADVFKASEVGNIFPLGIKFSKSFGYQYTDETGESQLVHMGSYGIGSSRVMGVLVEKFHDKGGILWPASVAPFSVHLVGLNLDDATIKQHCEILYQQLLDREIEVLYDDRLTVSAGEKLADADLIGIPLRLLVSKKTGTAVEIKRRSETATTLHEREEVIKML